MYTYNSALLWKKKKRTNSLVNYQHRPICKSNVKNKQNSLFMRCLNNSNERRLLALDDVKGGLLMIEKEYDNASTKIIILWIN